MAWEKKGLIYAPNGELGWAQTHAFPPTVELLGEERIRVYFASLDEHKFGRVTYLELELANPLRITYLSHQPLLEPGEPGTFDDCGVVPSCLVTRNGIKHLYYFGFQRSYRVPYLIFTGLATSPSDRLDFHKHARTPILDRTSQEPILRSNPFILEENGSLKMWYISGVNWTVDEQKVHYNNVIRYATSENGLDWQTDPHICIQPDFQDEYGIARPWVIREGSLYKMWYSVRSFSQLYAIGYAESHDGRHWERRDQAEEAALKPSESGWDSEMVCYPCVVDIGGRRYMFYNGNRHGASGFGYAVWH